METRWRLYHSTHPRSNFSQNLRWVDVETVVWSNELDLAWPCHVYDTLIKLCYTYQRCNWRKNRPHQPPIAAHRLVQSNSHFSEISECLVNPVHPRNHHNLSPERLTGKLIDFEHGWQRHINYVVADTTKCRHTTNQPTSYGRAMILVGRPVRSWSPRARD